MAYKISVIIPVYNSEKFLEECIKSICRQSFTDFELILINDGSSDSSGQICDWYPAEDGRIKVFHHTNKGVSCARNMGLQNATGDWVTFIDSDDFVEIDYLQNFVDNLDDSAGLIIQGMKKYFGNSSDIFYEFSQNIKLSKGAFLNQYSLIPYFFGPVSKLYDLNIIKKNNIKFDVTKSYAEDTLFNLDYLKHLNENIVLLKYNPYYYRATPNSLSTTKLNFKARHILFEDLAHRLESLTESKHHYFWYSVELIKALYVDDGVTNKRKVLSQLFERRKNLLLVPYQNNNYSSRLIRLLIKSDRIFFLNLLFKYIYRERS